MAKNDKNLSPPHPVTRSDVSIADILRKGNLSVDDPGPVVPPTAQVALGKQPGAAANSTSSSGETDGSRK